MVSGKTTLGGFNQFLGCTNLIIRLKGVYMEKQIQITTANFLESPTTRQCCKTNDILQSLSYIHEKFSQMRRATSRAGFSKLYPRGLNFQNK